MKTYIYVFIIINFIMVPITYLVIDSSILFLVVWYFIMLGTVISVAASGFNDINKTEGG